MSFPKIKITTFLLIILPSISPSLASENSPQKIAITPEFHMHIVNRLGNNKILLAHCKSKDNDLGVQNITAGSELSWKFRENIMWSTLYWCYLAPDKYSHVSLDVFNFAGHIIPKCDNHGSVWRYSYDCVWFAQDNGVYIRNFATGYDDFVSSWNKGRLTNLE
ncbi:hypothetical protein JCGZ_24967 [Jatropha curcas]|uniref:S-protein homolog n=1 Tax=Jatropha curcas TaxID=180498 RepID=A0A067L149_JATCU|nr:hypothetical protein JCGZ_24967 [Jatropha curcas]